MNQSLDAILAALPDVSPVGDVSPVERHAPALIDWHDLWAADPAPEWQVEPLLAQGRSHALYATAKAGKSLLILDVAAALATGRAALDRPAGPPLTVLYLDLEMTRDDLRERLADLGYGPADDLSRLVYYQLPDLDAADTAEGGAAIVELARYHAADLVVIDTLARVLAGDENSADTFHAHYRHCGARLKADGRTVVRLDHAGKDLTRGQRGSSAKTGDVDVVWQLVARDAEHLDLRATHRRMAWVPELVSLHRATDPVRHTRVMGSWPAGTANLAAQLDTLGLPVDASNRQARAALREAGQSAASDVLAAAIRWRRSTAAKPDGMTS